jgi:hypothetical protein
LQLARRNQNAALNISDRYRWQRRWFHFNRASRSFRCV